MKNLFKNKKLLAMVAIVLALCLSIGTAMIAFNTDIDIKQHVYCTDGVSIDLSQTTYPGDNSDAVKNLMALSEVPKNPVIKNTSETDAFVYMAVTIPFDTMSLTSYDGSPVYEQLTQVFNYGYNQTAGARDSWLLVEEGYFGDVKIVPISNVLQGASEAYGAYDAANKTVTYVWAYTGSNDGVLAPLAYKESTEALFDYIKVADIDGQTVIDGSTQLVTVSAYAIQADNIVNDGKYDAEGSTYEDVLTVWDILNKLTPAADVDEDEHPNTDVIIRKLIDGPSFNSIIKTAANGSAIETIRFGAYDAPDGVEVYDVSARQNKKVLAWFVDGTIFVSASDGSDLMANEDCSYMFSGLDALTTIEFANWDTAQTVDMSHMFDGCSAITYVDTSKFNTDAVLTTEAMFKNCSNLETVNCADLEMQNVTNISEMFFGCSNLNGIETNTWYLENCIDAEGLFQWCEKLKDVDLSGFEKNNITNMAYMFGGCNSLVEIDVTKMNTDKLMNAEGMFQSCISLTTPTGVGAMNMENVTNFSHMFQGCASLEELILKWNTKNAKVMDYMFEGCSVLSELTVSTFDTSKLTDCDYMFANGGFVNIYGSNWIDFNTVSAPNMFVNSPGLPDYDPNIIDWSKAYVGGYFALPPNTLVKGELFTQVIPDGAEAVVLVASPLD